MVQEPFQKAGQVRTGSGPCPERIQNGSGTGPKRFRNGFVLDRQGKGPTPLGGHDKGSWARIGRASIGALNQGANMGGDWEWRHVLGKLQESFPETFLKHGAMLMSLLFLRTDWTRRLARYVFFPHGLRPGCPSHGFLFSEEHPEGDQKNNKELLFEKRTVFDSSHGQWDSKRQAENAFFFMIVVLSLPWKYRCNDQGDASICQKVKIHIFQQFWKGMQLPIWTKLVHLIASFSPFNPNLGKFVKFFNKEHSWKHNKRSGKIWWYDMIWSPLTARRATKRLAGWLLQ